jgi:hypothetical protein
MLVRRTLAALSVAAVLVGVAGCKAKPATFKANVRLDRWDVVQTNEKGEILTADAEIVWAECPGASRETIRGSADWAKCMAAKHKPGDTFPVQVEWHWDDGGFYDWDVVDTDGCKRSYEDGDEASFDTVQECEDLKQHGAVTGFRCNRIPQAHLIAKCPWFRKH